MYGARIRSTYFSKYSKKVWRTCTPVHFPCSMLAVVCDLVNILVLGKAVVLDLAVTVEQNVCRCKVVVVVMTVRRGRSWGLFAGSGPAAFVGWKLLQE
jgi:hypothetical protein